MKRKSYYDCDEVSVKSEFKKRSLKNAKKSRMAKTLIRHGGWIAEI